VDLHFPNFTDGRAFSQAYLLRRRLVCGRHPRHRRCADRPAGADGAHRLRSAAGADAADAQRQFERFGGFYQADAVHTKPHFESKHEPARPRSGSGTHQCRTGPDAQRW
jgi:hypothetical protein